LKDAEIPFNSEVETIIIGPAGGYHEYHIWVSDDDWLLAIDLIKKYYRIVETTQEPFSGECPACGYVVNNKTVCPDCEISLCPNPTWAYDHHAFIQYLEKYNLK